jgi:homoserine O-succinyltransferase
MPDAALQRTERQFFELVLAAACGLAVQWRLFYIPEVPRGETGRLYLGQSYEDIDALWTSHLDGLIVTGTEPRSATLPDEPYWASLTKLVDWAEDHTISAIWSCLAAHAAVLLLDDIPRRALREKLSGIFRCSKAENHLITAGAPSRWRVPHSRYNELPEEALVSKGYCVLSRSRGAGTDIFVKHRKSLFIFLQGHPEYDAGALLREYRRDSERFLADERASYPKMPLGYFDRETRTLLAAYRERAVSGTRPVLMPSFPVVAKGKLHHSWRGLAIQLYANWLSYLGEQKAGNLRPLNSSALHNNRARIDSAHPHLLPS